MSESRSELLAWLNELLQINYTRVEQCGTGAAYCQILDSVYRVSPTISHTFVQDLLLTDMCILSGCANDARQNERKARIRIYSKFQSHAKCVQSETAGEGAYTFSLNHPSTLLSGD